MAILLKSKMSKFFDQSSSSSSESDSDNEIIVEQKPKKAQVNMYDSEEDEKKTRVVLPEKAKRFASLLTFDLFKNSS